MKVRALKTFEGIKDLERDVFPKAGDEWEVSEERARVLKEHGVVEIIEEVVLEPITEIKKEETVEYLSEPEEATGTIDYNVPEDAELKVEIRLEEKPKKKKSSKK